MLRIIKVVLVLFIFVSSAYGSTYYIDSVAGSDSNTSMQAQSQSTPWDHMPGMSGCTSNCASYSVQSGDIFVLKGGSIWTFPSTGGIINVTASNITIMGGQRLGTPWGTGYPVLDASGTSSDRNGIGGSYGISGLTIDGLKLYNIGNPSNGYGTWITLFSPSNLEIKNCFIDSNSVNAIGIGTSGRSCSHILIHDNTFQRQARIDIGAGDPYNIDDIQFYNNLFMGPGNAYTGLYHGDGIMVQGYGKTSYGITNLLIHHNKFYGDWSQGATALIYINGCSTSGGVCINSSQGLYSVQHAKIYDNVFATENNSTVSGDTSLAHGAISIYEAYHDDIKFYNNTISVGSYTTTPVPNCILIYKGTNLEFKNNILSGCKNGFSIDNAAGASITIDNMLFNTRGGNYLVADHRTGGGEYHTCAAVQSAGFCTTFCGNADPKYVALPSGGVIGSGNWHLQSSSPAINKGVSLSSYFITDLDGVSRPQGSAWDIGAYEYSGSPSPPTNLRIIGP